jgi:hypothetical protein
MPWDSGAERDFWRHRCLDSFWWFFRYAWGYDFNPKGAAGHHPWLDEATHKPACDWYQEHALRWLYDRKKGAGDQTKLIIVVPRDWGKTTLFTQAGQAWLHLHDPELATYTGAETTKRAWEVLDGIKAVISGDDKHSRFSWLYGSQRHIGRTWKRDSIVTAARSNLTRRDASFGTWAVESGMVGLHPDGCFFDDPNTYEQMKRKGDWLTTVNNHLDSLIPVFQSDAIWVLTGTRYGDGDHLGKTIKYEGARTVSGMAMPGVAAHRDGAWDVFFMDAEDDKYPESDPRHFVMPAIWSPSRIKSFKRRNPIRYYAQVRNNPTQSPHNMLSPEVCQKFLISEDKLDLKKIRISIHIDTAFKKLERAAQGDMNVIATVGHLMDGTARCIYLGSAASRDWDTNELGKHLIEAVKSARTRFGRVMCITDEEDIGGKPGVWPAWINNIFKTAKVPMPEIKILNRGTTHKEQRLREAAALWLDGRMLLLNNAPYIETLIEQMCKIGMTEYEDFADACADCFHKEVYSSVYLTDSVVKAERRNPFDDVLKPGGIGDNAAEEIAKMTDEKLAMYARSWDVVHP